MKCYTKSRSPVLDGLPYKFYISMPNLFAGLLANVYCNKTGGFLLLLFEEW